MLAVEAISPTFRVDETRRRTFVAVIVLILARALDWPKPRLPFVEPLAVRGYFVYRDEFVEEIGCWRVSSDIALETVDFDAPNRSQSRSCKQSGITRTLRQYAM